MAAIFDSTLTSNPSASKNVIENSSQATGAQLIQSNPTNTPTLVTALASKVAASPAHSNLDEPSPIDRTATRHTAVVLSDRTYAPAVQVARPKVKPLVEEKDEPAVWWLGPSLLLATGAMVFLGWLHFYKMDSRRSSGGESISSQAAFDSARTKIEFYKKQLGRRLNRDRVQVELDNQWTAPPLKSNETNAESSGSGIMMGVPLLPEGYGSKSSRDRDRQTQPISMDHPDSRIQYSLQEEQLRDETQKASDQQYIREFIDNARREGYDVKLNSNLEVISVTPYHGRKPAESGYPGTSR